MFPAVGAGYQNADQDYAGNRGYPPPPDHGRGRRPPFDPPPRRKRLLNYPRYGHRNWTRWLPSFRLIALFFLTGIIMVVVVVVTIYDKVALPPPDASVQAQTTVIYYANGSDVIAKLATQDREDIVLAQVPVDTRHAVLAAEDHTFYTNSGIDPKSIARAVWSNVRGNATQGGSTISQQYVKNVYNQRQRTFKRKVTEAFLAIKVNKEEDKDKILERYLNTIYWGRGAYGMQAATHAYFGPSTDVSKLTVSQSAFLAGIINAPSLSDPRDSATSKARAERRWGVVLDQMVRYGWLTPQQRAVQKFPRTVVQVQQTSVSGQNAYLEQMAMTEVETKAHLTKDQIETGGYKIVTTYDKDLINSGVQAVKDGLPKKRPVGLRIGMAAIDPRTGAIKAIYGGTNINAQENQATLDRAEGGSTFKAFGLIAALEDGKSLKDTYNGVGTLHLPHVKTLVTNDDNASYGYINLIKALAYSVNTVFVQLNQDVGAAKTFQAAVDAGVPANTTPNLLKNSLVNVLGPANVHPLDMAGAYGTFASGGIRHTPYGLQSVSYIGTGKSVYQAPKPSNQRVFDADAVADLTYAMQQVVKEGTASTVHLNRPVAGKTGTSSQSKSAWFVGFTPQLVTAVAMHEQVQRHGKAVILPMKAFGDVTSIVGGGYPARIWADFMTAALANKPVLQFPQPVYGGEVTNTPPPTAAPPTATSQPTTRPTTQPTQTSQPTQTAQPTQPSQTPQPTRSHFPQPPTATATLPTQDPKQ